MTAAQYPPAPDIKPRITYRSDLFYLPADRQLAHLRALFPVISVAETLPVCDREELGETWEGFANLPSPSRHANYGESLAFVVERCRAVLAKHGVRVDSAVRPDRPIRLENRLLQASKKVSWLSGRFQLGRRWGAHAPRPVREKLFDREVGLDPASALTLLTVMVMEHGPSVLQPMWIDCPGAEYDPEGKKKYADCPRWNVSTDFCEEDGTVAFLSLDWNWDHKDRARANHGSATFLLDVLPT